jgi:hypothetical protein
MKFPNSTNTDGANPAHGDIVSNVGSSHGVRLTGGSTGGIVEPAGDDANITLTVRARGTGAVVVGNSSNAVQANGTLRVGSSGTAVTELRKFTVQFTAPQLSSGLVSGAESTYTVAGVSTGTLLLFTPTNPINALYTVRPRCSTADELTLAWGNIGDSTLGSGESTNRGVLWQIR